MTDDWDDSLDDEPEPEALPTQGLFGSNDQFHKAWSEWDGLPEFIQEDLQPNSTLVVKFQTAADRVAFGEMIGQPVNTWRSGAGIWYPKISIGHYWDLRYRDASADKEKETS